MILNNSESKSESAFEKVLRICLTPGLFDLLHDDSNNMLYCSKSVTNIVIDHYIKNKAIKLSTAKQMEEKKRKMIRHLFVNIDSNLCENLKTTTFRLDSLTFSETFNQPIKAGVLPSSLKRLTFGRRFNQPIEMNVLPQSLSHLSFGPSFYQTIQVGALPPSLKYLSFSYYGYHQNEMDTLLSSLGRLTFGHNLVRPNSFPSVLNSLALYGGCDDKEPIKIGVLPPLLNDLVISMEYDQRIDNNIQFSPGVNENSICRPGQCNSLPNYAKFGWKFDPLDSLPLIARTDVSPPISTYLTFGNNIPSNK